MRLQEDHDLKKATIAITSLLIAWPESKIEVFCQQWLVAELSLFGSVLRDDFHEQSDIDLLIEFLPTADWSLWDNVNMQQALAILLQCKVDLVSKRAIQRSQNPIRRQEILSTARVVYKRAANAPAASS